MAKRMLVDATHSEETRIVVVSGHRVEEFDFETSTKKQLKGNIYLARVTRVEPSLQAAFVEYGGNRHGFLAFGEIHPDYYRIPVADRQALLAAAAAEDDDHPTATPPATSGDAAPTGDSGAGVPPAAAPASLADALESRAEAAPDQSSLSAGPTPAEIQAYEPPPDTSVNAPRAEFAPPVPDAIPAAADNIAVVSAPADPLPVAPLGDQTLDEQPQTLFGETLPAPEATPSGAVAEMAPAEPPQTVESIGGGEEIEEAERRRRHRMMRHYKIQEVIKRGQILLVQVVKEERGTKGAALTTYMSLAGRYCVLMPNTSRGGGISRRITSAQDRRRLKQMMEELQVPEGMAVILRTAGMERANSEIKRDYDYLMRLWDDIRELTLKSKAPALVYEEGNLVKRAIRDLYSSDIEEIQVEGEAGYEAARQFMNMLMPDHIDRVRRYDDPSVPLFQRFQVEQELDHIHSPTVRLRSGGYIVINQTEALVAIDVNSGRSTRERHIEETALKTNLEAADEIARQLRLRDLAGLIVIDFIDMDEHRHQHSVERRFKDAMRSDRARIQIGRISPFGLLELSRQRLRPSLAEVSSEICPHCGGTGRVRSTESTALHVLRGVEEEGMKLRTAEAIVNVPSAVALYLLNHKRDALQRIEGRYGMRVIVAADEALIPPAFRLDRMRHRDGVAAQGGRAGAAAPIRADIQHVDGGAPRAPDTFDHGDEEEVPPPRASDMAPAQGEYRRDQRDPQDGGEDGGRGGRGRGRRRRRGRGRGDRPDHPPGENAPLNEPLARVPDMTVAEMETDAGGTPLVQDVGTDLPAGGTPGEGGRPGHDDSEEARGRRRRRRGRRGGRRRHGEGAPHEGDAPYQAGPAPEQASAPSFEPVAPRIVGPGHDLPPESPFAAAPPASAPRIPGPGDEHDWPWNRREERFPEPPPPPPPPAPAAAPSYSEPPRAEPTPAPTPAAEEAPSSVAPPVEEAPKGPPRSGWWKRLTT